MKPFFSFFQSSALAAAVLAALCLVPLAACAQQDIGKTILRIHGSNTIGARLIPDIARRFFLERGYHDITQVPGEKDNEFFVVALKNTTPFNIEIQAHGSSTSFKSFEAGLCDVGMASRRIKEKEVEKLAHLGDMNSLTNEHVLAIDGIAVIVNAANSVSALDVDTLRAIFTGEISNWKTLGAGDLPIRVYARDDNSGTYDTFKSMVLGKKKPLVATARRYESNASLSDDVAADPAAIGFVGMPYIRNAKALAVKKDAGSAGILPTTFTAAYEEYPLSRRLYLYTPTEPANPLAKEFAEFALGSTGQKSVAMLGFAKLSLDMEERNINTARFKDELHRHIYAKETLGGRRVNFNFRFIAGDDFLENRSRKDLQRFIHYIQHPDQYYYESLLVGINGCDKAEAMRTTIIEAVGSDNFHVPPQKICLDYARGPSGEPLETVVEVWLRVVDDGA